MFKTTLTLGPATLAEMVLEGMVPVADRFRLNAAHLSIDSLEAWLERIESLFVSAGRRIPVVLDLQGAKMRVGNLPAVSELPATVFLRLSRESAQPGEIPVPHELFFSEIEKGDRVTLNDARIELQIVDHGPTLAEARVIRNGPLSAGKGINRARHPIPYKKVSETDAQMIDMTSGVDFVEYAFSFVNTGEEAALIRPRIQGKRLIAKLERPESLRALRAVDSAFDELWFCRGDLGAQVGLKEMARLQIEFEGQIPQLKKPAWLAGQVLEYMTHFPQPTRSEVAQLARVETAGYEGIVLSDETAIGKNPLEVCRFLQQWRKS